MLDFTLSDDLLEIQKQCRAFAREHILPVAWDYDDKDETPVEIIRKAWEAGVINGAIPKKYGGKGYGVLEGVVATEEFAAACPGLATSIFDTSLGLEPLLLCENEAAREKYLPRMIEEFRLMCFGTSEPTMGSDVSAIRCRAEKDGEDWILNGTKYWITNGGIADYMTVFATVDPKLAHKGICGFVVELDWEGVTRGRIIPKMGQRLSNTVGLHFDNVRVPAENVLAEPGKGFVLAMKTFSHTRPAIGAFAVGAARSAMEYAIDYAKKRQAFGMPISAFQAIQFKIAEMYQKVETARLLTLKAAWEADQGMDSTVNASIAKMYSSEKALEVVDEALQVMGGYGYTQLYPIEKLFRDTRLFRIYEGTSEVQRMVVAGHAMGAYEPVMPKIEDLPMHRGERKEGEKAFRCRMCGHIHYGDEAPEQCPVCFFPKGAFKELE